jgi:hypothetical protein
VISDAVAAVVCGACLIYAYFSGYQAAHVDMTVALQQVFP